MELTNTLFIKFVLGLLIILALSVLIFKQLKFIPQLNFRLKANLFYKFQHYNYIKFSLLFPKPSQLFWK